MHASLEQLISIRDEEPVAADVQQHVRACGRCAKVLNGLLAAREALTALPDPLPPADAWARVSAAADRRAPRWLPAAGMSLVASIAAALLLVNLHLSVPTPAGDAAAVSPASGQPANVGQLMAQSQYLERAVLQLNNHADQMVVSAGTASAVAALEDRIALVDYEISSAGAQDASDARVAKLWKQRVDLLQSLAAVRYAQVASNGI